MTTRAKNNILINFLYYLFFNIFVWLTHLFFISVFTFFHFILDHPINVIENWIYYNGWEVIALTKVVAFLVVLKFVNLKSFSKEPLRDMVVEGFVLPRKEFLIVIIFFITSVIFLGNPLAVGGPDFNFGKTIFSFFCFLLFFLIDIFTLNSIERVYPINSNHSILKPLLMPLIFMFFTKFSFGLVLDVTTSNQTIVGKGIYLIFYIHFFFILFLDYLEGMNWSYAFIYLFAFAAPLNSLFGFDPVWGENFSLYKMRSTFSLLDISLLFLVGFVYLFLKRKKEKDRETHSIYQR
mgnify:CR=1 FL=1